MERIIFITLPFHVWTMTIIPSTRDTMRKSVALSHAANSVTLHTAQYT